MVRKILRECGVMLIIIGLTGAIFFFPMKLNEGKTCLAQQYISGHRNEVNHTIMDHDHQLAQDYIIPYGFIWWSSLGLFSFGLYLTRKKGGKQVQIS